MKEPLRPGIPWEQRFHVVLESGLTTVKGKGLMKAFLLHCPMVEDRKARRYACENALIETELNL